MSVFTGPGRRSCLNLIYHARQARYDKKALRRLRAARGVGRPPHVLRARRARAAEGRS